MTEKVHAKDFPEIGPMMKCKWAPIFVSPVVNSPERLVVAVVATSDTEFHIATASKLTRLNCLYGDAVDTVLFAINVFLAELEHCLATKKVESLKDFKSPTSALFLGKMSEAEGLSAAQVARAWLASLSSLHDQTSVPTSDMEALAEDEVDVARDTLSQQVFQFVQGREPRLRQFFSEAIRGNVARRVKPHSIVVDFTGTHAIANFGTLNPFRPAAAVDKIKRQLWDLIAYRDKNKHATMFDAAAKAHELIVYHMELTDPTLSVRQAENLGEALTALDEQASKEEVLLLPMTAIPTIGAHILQSEGISIH